MNETADLTAFLRARLDEEEARTRTFTVPEWMICENGGEFDYTIAPVQTEMAGEAIADTWREDAASWIAFHDPDRAIREIEADRALMDEYRACREYSDRLVRPPFPADVLAERVRAATRVLIMEHVIKTRATIWRGHPDYQEAWKP